VRWVPCSTVSHARTHTWRALSTWPYPEEEVISIDDESNKLFVIKQGVVICKGVVKAGLGQGLTLVPISAELELTLPLSAQLKLSLSPI